VYHISGKESIKIHVFRFSFTPGISAWLCALEVSYYDVRRAQHKRTRLSMLELHIYMEVLNDRVVRPL